MSKNTFDENNNMSMTKEEALEVLGLDANANAYAIDEKFYKLTKMYRTGDKANEEKLEEITIAYDIASGRKGRRDKFEDKYDNDKKFFGKTSAQWKVYFGYTWWKILIGIVAIVIAIVIVLYWFMKEDYDVKVLYIGHFSVDTSVLTDYFSENDYVNPYVSSADVVVDDSESQSNSTLNGEATASVLLSIGPDILIFDEDTMPYYLSTLANLDDYYEFLEETLPDAIFSEIEPITYSMEDYYILTIEEDEEYVCSEDEKVDHIYGLKFSDTELYSALGLTSEWSDGRESVVFCINEEADSMNDAKTDLIQIFKDVNVMINDYSE